MDNRIFTSFWHHHIEHFRYHGSFQLLISASLNTMEGQWIGYSESGNKIDSGKWKWEKNADK